MRNHSRKTAWVLVAFALLFVLASVFFPAMASHHDCSGEDCPVCVQLRAWTIVLRLFSAVVLCVWLFRGRQLCARFFASMRSCVGAERSPVALKTKLLN